jgi:hypothetical protein
MLVGSGVAMAEVETGKAPSRGAAIYLERCANCHGEQGRGTDFHPPPLIGDLPVSALAKFIHETMPEGEPEECVDEEAELVAEYIHDAFYSPAAQDRINPVTVQFSRLTVRQLEQSLCDLLGSFDEQPAWTDERGLQALFFDNRRIGRWGPKTALIKRTDPAIDFNFGKDRPEGLPQRDEVKAKDGGAKYAPEEYGIRWTGAVIAPQSGDYEFIVETCNGVRMWVNHPRKEEGPAYTSEPTPLIDGLVRAGEEVVYRETIRLIGGRAYPLRIDFLRFAEPQGYIRLKWKRPGHAEEVIASRFLLPQEFPRQFVLTTPFPPDDRSQGYERGTSVSQAWQDAVTSAALETAAYTVADLLRLADVSDEDSPDERAEKIRDCCEQFVERAFRRPLSDVEKEFFISARFDGVREKAGVRRVVLMALMSSRFLYREHGQSGFDPHAVASWLSFTLWDSLPDAELLEAADEDRLHTREQIGEQVDRMLADPRALAKLREFTRQWLHLDRFSELSKDSERYPEFDARLSSDLRTSLELFLDDVLQSPDASFRRLMLDEEWYVNERLAHFYGVQAPESGGFEKISEDPENGFRAGVLTHPLLLSKFAYGDSSSPIHRGVFISQDILGRFLKPPPDDIELEIPETRENLTMRELVTMQTKPAACQGCHSMINGLGFSLEQFDAVGRYRLEEKSQPIDASGVYLDRVGKETTFNGARDLVRFLAESPECQDAFIQQLFQYLVKQPVRAFGPDRSTELRDHFAEHELNIRELVREIAISTALEMRRLEPPPETVSTR